MNTIPISAAKANRAMPEGPPESSTEVLVVGAGPTGLMLACQLVRRGIRTVIIDRHSGPAMQSRAMAVHARTLEIYDQLGIAGEALDLGRPGYGANFWVEGRQTARVPFSDVGKGQSPFPYVLMLGQDDNERILGRHLASAGFEVRWNTELVALEQGVDSAVATLKLPDGSQATLDARYVAGCDGGQSAVRTLNDIGFPGAPYEHVFFVADTEAVGPMVPDELNVYLWREGFHLFFPIRGKDRWRVIGILPGRFMGVDDLTFDMVAPSIRHEAGAELIFRQCDWFSTYRIHHRCTERFRKGRCFVLGDAAHVHSPMGGQGMNTGLQDAYNLAWKLALVLRGRAGDSLLDTFESERMGVARTLLSSTDRAFTLLVRESKFSSLFRTKIFANVAKFAMRVARLRKLAFRTISQIGISYHDSTLSRNLPGLPKGAPEAGDRFPWIHLRFDDGTETEDLFQRLDDTRFNLLVFGQGGPVSGSSFSDLLSVHVVSADEVNAEEIARAGVPAQSFYLLRPDGHVALAGTRLDVSAIQRWFADASIKKAQRTPGAREAVSKAAQHG